MRVLLTVNAAWNIWNFRRDLVASLVGDGHAVTILAPPDDTVPLLEALGARFVPLPMKPDGLGPLEGLRLVMEMGRAIRRIAPDLVLSYTIKNNVAAGIATARQGVAFVPNVTGLGTAFLSSGVMQRVARGLCRVAFRRALAVFFQNPDDREQFVRGGLVGDSVARVIPGSGVDLQHFQEAPPPPDEEAPLFLMVSRLAADKGVREFAGAARAVKERHPQARFVILGDPHPSNRTAIPGSELDAWLRDGILEHQDPVGDVRPVLASAHCVVLPSYREGLPRALLEAAAMGRPVITTDVPGCREVLEDGMSGFLCEVRNASSLAEAIERFLGLGVQERAAMGAAGRRLVEDRFSVERVVEAYRDVVRTVASHSDPPRPS